MSAKKKIIRKSESTKLAGVCGAIAGFFGIKSKTVRIAYFVFTVLTAFFPGILLYLFLMLVFPREINE